MHINKQRRFTFLQAATLWIVFAILFACLFSMLGFGVPLPYGDTIMKFVACSSLLAVAGVQLLVGFVSGFLAVRLWRFSGFSPAVPEASLVAVSLAVGAVLFVISFGGALLGRGSLVGVCA